MYRKNFDRRYLLIIVVVLIALTLVVLSISLKKEKKLNLFERVIKDTGNLVIKIVKTPFDIIGGILDEREDKENIYKKYKELKQKEDSIDSVISANENLESEIKKLKETLNLNTILSDKILLSATVIHRNIGYFYEEVTIDKGSKDGIEKDMAVINSKGLVGYTSKVSSHSSTVKLLSNDNMDNKISIKIKAGDDYVYGLISKYDSKTNTYTVEGISQNTEIPIDADVVTTGMGNLFPSGLLIGKVKDKVSDNFDLSKVLEVKSAVDFNDLDYISVVKKDIKWNTLS